MKGQPRARTGHPWTEASKAGREWSQRGPRKQVSAPGLPLVQHHFFEFSKAFHFHKAFEPGKAPSWHWQWEAGPWGSGPTPLLTYCVSWHKCLSLSGLQSRHLQHKVSRHKGWGTRKSGWTCPRQAAPQRQCPLYEGFGHSTIVHALPFFSQQGHDAGVSTPSVQARKLRLRHEKGCSKCPGRAVDKPHRRHSVHPGQLQGASFQATASHPPLALPAFPTPSFLPKVPPVVPFGSSCADLAWTPARLGCVHTGLGPTAALAPFTSDLNLTLSAAPRGQGTVSLHLSTPPSGPTRGSVAVDRAYAAGKRAGNL